MFTLYSILQLYALINHGRVEDFEQGGSNAKNWSIHVLTESFLSVSQACMPLFMFVHFSIELVIEFHHRTNK